MGDRDNLYELPKGWCWTRVEQLAEVVRGASPRPAGDPRYFGGNIPWITVGCLTADAQPYLTSVSEFVTEAGRAASRYIEPETLLLTNSGATLGVPKITKIGGCINDGSVALLHIDYPLKLYLYYFLSSLTKRLRTINQGAAQPNLNTGIVKAIFVPLPPLAEQSRIIIKIEELFTQLDAGVELLKKLKAKLKRYRQAVLKAAVEGKLTKDWREAHQGELEPASVLLERILKERREKWEAEQLAQMKAKGKTPKDDSWKLKYKEPVAPDTFDLPELPEGWVWVSLEQISNASRNITYGVIKLGEYIQDGVSTLRSSNVRHLLLDLSNVKKISSALSEEYQRTVLQGGEILITIRGTLGGVASVPKKCAGYNISREVALITPLPQILSSCCAILIGSPTVQNWLSERTRGIAYIGINLETLKETPIPLFTLSEQQALAEEVERRLSVADELEKVINQNLKRAEKLRQSILKKAFEGKLVPQDPTDEPADKLLERIKAEKAKREAEAKAKKKRKQPGKSQQLELF